MDNIDSVKLQIQKLFALAKDNPNGHEREAAMEKARDLLNRYNLDRLQVEGFRSFRVLEHEIDLRLEPWLQFLVYACCKMYNTDYYRKQVTVKGWNPVIIGTQENIEVTVSMYTWLAKVIREQSRKHFQSPRFRRSFCVGAAAELAKRAELLTADQAATSKGTGLMVLRTQFQKDIDEFKDTLGLARAGRSRPMSVNTTAVDMGRDYGRTVNLNKQIGSQEPKRIGSHATG